MKLIGNKAYPGKPPHNKFFTLKQMKDFLRRSKGPNRDYWKAWIKHTYGDKAL
tara:strand:- start:1564 stop:1722 length:159 start_codon:yes stop_codon:yes gene_type:complete